jgi:hypothetical protein
MIPNFSFKKNEYSDSSLFLINLAFVLFSVKFKEHSLEEMF